MTAKIKVYVGEIEDGEHPYYIDPNGNHYSGWVEIEAEAYQDYKRVVEEYHAWQRRLEPLERLCEQRAEAARMEEKERAEFKRLQAKYGKG